MFVDLPLPKASRKVKPEVNKKGKSETGRGLFIKIGRKS